MLTKYEEFVCDYVAKKVESGTWDKEDEANLQRFIFSRPDRSLNRILIAASAIISGVFD